MITAPGIRGIKISIWSEGKELPEYNDSTLENTSRLAQRYVQSEADKQFELHVDYGLDTQFNSEAVSVSIKVDGLTCATYIHPRTKALPFKWKSRGRSYSADHIQAYRFAQTEIAASSSRNTDIEHVKTLGCIELKIQHCVMLGKSEDQSGIRIRSEGTGAVTEQMLKGRALSNSVALDEPTARTSNVVYWHIEPIGHPYLVHLLYRSEQDLKSMHVIPRTPSPEPLYERDLATMSQADLIEMQAQLRACKNSKESALQIKREMVDVNDSPAPRAKRNKNTQTILTLEDDGSFREEEVAVQYHCARVESID